MSVLNQVGEKILAEYGKYHGDVRMSPLAEMSIRAETHGLSCSDELFLDFVQMCFEIWPHLLAERGVVPVNRIFQEEGIAPELTTALPRERKQRAKQRVSRGAAGESEF